MNNFHVGAYMYMYTGPCVQLQMLQKVFSHWFNNDMMATFGVGGYYQVQDIFPKTRLVVLNTLYYSKYAYAWMGVLSILYIAV